MAWGVGTTNKEATRRIHRPIGTECPPTETLVEQVNLMHTGSLKSMIIIQKRMLKSHIVCQGIKCLQTPCGQAGTPSAELADRHSGPVGPKHNSGLTDRPHIQTTKSISATFPSPFNRTTTTGKGGSLGNAQEGSHQENNPCKWVLLEPVAGPQEGWGPINLKTLNQCVQNQHFKVEGIHNLKDLQQPEDWLAKVDLKDAFFTIPMHSFHRQYLKFIFQGKTYQFTCLPFALSSALWVSTKTLKPALALLRQKSVRA